jgi:hypothetical protein
MLWRTRVRECCGWDIFLLFDCVMLIENVSLLHTGPYLKALSLVVHTDERSAGRCLRTELPCKYAVVTPDVASTTDII